MNSDNDTSLSYLFVVNKERKKETIRFLLSGSDVGAATINRNDVHYVLGIPK